MKANGKIAVSPGLNQICNENDGSTEIMLLERVKQYADMFSEHMEKDSNGVVGGVMELMDHVIKESARVNSCKKGCNFCCRVNVDISEEEAKFIAFYCKLKGIEIDRTYLKQQLTHRKELIWASPVAPCVFLKNGECSIYAARPLICRKYMVGTDPALCNVIDYPPPYKGVAIVNDPEAEIVFSGFLNACKKYPTDRMPRQLLKCL